MLGEQLKKLRRQKGLTQKELADYLYVTNGAVAMWERNRCLPDVHRLVELANFFDVTVDYLLDYESITTTQKQEIQNIVETLRQLAEQLEVIFLQK